MKTTTIIFLLLAFLASVALANIDTLHVELIDSLDAPTNHEFFHYGITSGWPIAYNYSGTGNWDLAMGDSFMVWLPGSDRIIFIDPYDSTEVDTIANFEFGPVDAVGTAIMDSIVYVCGGGGSWDS